MATPRKLVENLAEILGVSAATVVVHDRNLATAQVPLRTVAGRGRAAAKVTSMDAANLLIAVAASESVKDSVTTVLKYRDLLGSQAIDSGIAKFDALPSDHTLGQALAALIQAAAERDITLGPDIVFKISFQSPRATAKVEWTVNGRSSYTHYDAKSKWPRRSKVQAVGDLERQASVGESTIFYLGATVGDSA